MFLFHLVSIGHYCYSNSVSCVNGFGVLWFAQTACLLRSAGVHCLSESMWMELYWQISSACCPQKIQSFVEFSSFNQQTPGDLFLFGQSDRWTDGWTVTVLSAHRCDWRRSHSNKLDSIVLILVQPSKPLHWSEYFLSVVTWRRNRCVCIAACGQVEVWTC